MQKHRTMQPFTSTQPRDSEGQQHTYIRKHYRRLSSLLPAHRTTTTRTETAEIRTRKRQSTRKRKRNNAPPWKRIQLPTRASRETQASRTRTSRCPQNETSYTTTANFHHYQYATRGYTTTNNTNDIKNSPRTRRTTTGTGTHSTTTTTIQQKQLQILFGKHQRR